MLLNSFHTPMLLFFLQRMGSTHSWVESDRHSEWMDNSSTSKRCCHSAGEKSLLIRIRLVHDKAEEWPLSGIHCQCNGKALSWDRGESTSRQEERVKRVFCSSVDKIIPHFFLQAAWLLQSISLWAIGRSLLPHLQAVTGQ